jgi:iron(III) transport system permease protein
LATSSLTRRSLVGRLPHPAAPAPLWLLLPALGVAALAALPICYLLIRAAGVEESALALVLRPRTLEVLGGSVALAAGVGAGSIALGLPLAWLTTRTDLPGRRLWTVLTVVPLAVPSYVMALGFVAALGPRGALSELLRSLGLPGLPSIYGLGGAVLVLTLATYPYVLLGARAALLRADPALEEAGRSLGDRPLTVFRRVTWPLLLPAVGAGALLAVLYALADFGAVAILQFDSFARSIYIQYRASFDRSQAALLALILVGATLLVAWLEARARGRRALIGQAVARRPPPQIPLGRWRWPALGFSAAVVALGLAVPGGTLLYWLARGLAQGEQVRVLGDAVLGSVIGGSAAALIAVALALPVALLVVRHPGRLSGWIEGVLYSAYAVPGIVVALAVVVFVLNLAPIVYQTLLVLVLAYAVRFLPQAVGPLRTSLAQAGSRLTEAARTLGDSPLRAFRRVTLPLLRPGIAAAAALVFLTTVKELPITLLLAPAGFDTLATAVWSAASEGFFARAAAPAVLLTVVAGATVGLLFRSEEPPR